MSADSGRLHALDGLRASMMLLGLVLHSSTSYTATPLGAAWPYQDSHTSPLLDIVVFVIHLFRMPVFFIMAGFFAALLYFRDGRAAFLANRIRRVLVPLVCAWVVIYPFVAAGFAYALSGGGALNLAGLRAAFATVDDAPSLVHLWFLYDLMFFYVLAFLLAPLLLTHAPAAMRTIADVFARTASGYPGLLLCVAVTTLTLLPMEKPALETSTSFVPSPIVLAAYGVFFLFGWILFTRRHVLGEFTRRPLLSLAIAVVGAVVYLVVAVPYFPIPDRAPVLAYASASLAIWLWSYAVITLFLAYAESPRPLQRYMADGSYWIYLIHLPFTIWMPGVLAPLALPALVKCGIVLSVTTAVTAGTYYLFVRSTWIGEALNGRRYARRPAEPRPVEVPATMGS